MKVGPPSLSHVISNTPEWAVILLTRRAVSGTS
jgi:hypothetical protein